MARLDEIDAAFDAMEMAKSNDASQAPAADDAVDVKRSRQALEGIQNDTNAATGPKHTAEKKVKPAETTRIKAEPIPTPAVKRESKPSLEAQVDAADGSELSPPPTDAEADSKPLLKPAKSPKTKASTKVKTEKPVKKEKPDTPKKRKLAAAATATDDATSDHPSPSKVARAVARGSAWTAAERLQLLEYINCTPPDARKWAEAVPERNLSQARNQWHDKIYPCLCAAIASAKTHGRSTARNTAWTPAERTALLDHVFARGQAQWEKAVPGRSGHMCRGTWRDTVYPLLKRALADSA